MSIEKKPFRTYDDEQKEKKYEHITLRMNKKEMEQIKEDMKALQQAKQGTAIKQMLDIARYVVHQSEMGHISRILYNNVRRNVRTGINEVEDEYLANVKQK